MNRDGIRAAAANLIEALDGLTIGEASAALLVATAKIISVAAKDESQEMFSAIESDLNDLFDKYAPLDKH